MYDNKNKLIGILLLAAVVFSFFTIYVYSSNKPATSAKAAALYEPETKTFLYKKNENEHLAMASTTKIMTALIALEVLDNDELIEVDERSVGIEGSSIYLEANEIISAEDLVYALILQSANDAAAAIAYRIAGSIEDFAAIMNERALSMGLNDTNFENPHGLDGKNHYTTAHDLAIISANALENPLFRKISSTYKKNIESSLKSRLVVNHNKMLKLYDSCIGVKTGYTKKSGRSLVSAAEKDGLTLIAVTINAPDDWNDHTKLLDYGYSELEKTALAQTGEFSYKIPVLCGENDFVNISNKDSFSYIHRTDGAKLEYYVKLSRYVAAPINNGDILGSVIFTKNGTKIGEIPLYANETINKKEKKGLFSALEKDK